MVDQSESAFVSPTGWVLLKTECVITRWAETTRKAILIGILMSFGAFACVDELPATPNQDPRTPVDFAMGSGSIDGGDPVFDQWRPPNDQAVTESDAAINDIDMAEMPMDMTPDELDMDRPPVDMEEPEPDIGRPDPDMERADPDMERPDPDMERPDPDMEIPDPDMGRPDPDMGRPDPDMGRPDPDMGRPDPDMGRPDPDMGFAEEDVGPPQLDSISAEGTDSTRIRGANGGEEFEDDCPPGHVVHGIEGQSGHGNRRWIYRIRTLCARVEIGLDGVVSTTPGPSVPEEGFRGNAGGAAGWQSACDPNHAVVGFRGHSGSHVDALAIACSPLNVEEDRVIPDRDGLVWMPRVGTPGGNAFGSTLCPDGEGATGSFVRAEGFLNAYGLRCSRLMIAPLDEE
jgi:hypothetical protein